MKKILITGSNGLVGQKIVSLALKNDGLSLLATSRAICRIPGLPAKNFRLMDITDPAQINACFESFKPDVVIHAAAMTQVDLCETNREECRRINVEGTANLLRAAEKCGSHFIYLSTDFVFDGKNGPYREEDAPGPVNFYGQSKLDAENLVRQSSLPWSILRTILVYGVLPVMPRPNIVMLVKSKLEKKEIFRVTQDQFRMPTLAEDLAGACLACAEKKAQGLYHISGRELVSIYDFARIIAAVFKLDTGLLQPVATAALNEPAKRPPKTGFVLDKAIRDLGYQPHSITEGLKLVSQQAVIYNPSAR